MGTIGPIQQYELSQKSRNIPDQFACVRLSLEYSQTVPEAGNAANAQTTKTAQGYARTQGIKSVHDFYLQCLAYTLFQTV